uniref:Uncharacterized protein n=1 Tax=Arundo donax TaxID=35708 RepID=A0A0A9QX30_ARUDO
MNCPQPPQICSGALNIYITIDEPVHQKIVEPPHLLSFATILTNSSVMSLQFLSKLLPTTLSKLHLTYSQGTRPSIGKQRYQYHNINKRA